MTSLSKRQNGIMRRKKCTVAYENPNHDSRIDTNEISKKFRLTRVMLLLFRNRWDHVKKKKCSKMFESYVIRPNCESVSFIRFLLV